MQYFTAAIENFAFSFLGQFGEPALKAVKIILVFLLLEIVAYWLIRVLARGSKGHAYRMAEKQRVETFVKSFSGATRAVARVIALIIILPEFGVNTTPIIATAGVLSLAFSMAAKEFVQDFISGFFILLDDQIRLGDAVKIDTIDGIVRDITLRRTIIDGLDGREYFIPNRLINITSKKKAG